MQRRPFTYDERLSGLGQGIAEYIGREYLARENVLKATYLVIADVMFIDGETFVRNVHMRRAEPTYTDGRYHLRVRVHAV